MAGAFEQNIFAVVIFDNLGFNAKAVKFRCGVHVSDKAHRLFALVSRCGRQNAVNCAVFDMYIFKPKGIHLLFKAFGNIKLNVA